jgi:hypothetical protein
VLRSNRFRCILSSGSPFSQEDPSLDGSWLEWQPLPIGCRRSYQKNGEACEGGPNKAFSERQLESAKYALFSEKHHFCISFV